MLARTQTGMIPFLWLMFAHAAVFAQERAKTWSEFRQSKKGESLYHGKNYANAIESFQDALSHHPDSKLNSFNFGTTLLQAGRPSEAVEQLEKSLEAEQMPLKGKAHYNLGQAYEALKKNEEARKIYQKGLEELQSIPEPPTETVKKLKEALERLALQEEQQQRKQKENQSDQADQDQQQKQRDKDQQEDKNKQGQQDQQDQKQQNQDGQQEQQTKDGKSSKEKNPVHEKPKQSFKGEKLEEQDAERILQQLKEQEKRSKQRLLKEKLGKEKKEVQNDQDW